MSTKSKKISNRVQNKNNKHLAYDNSDGETENYDSDDSNNNSDEDSGNNSKSIESESDDSEVANKKKGKKSTKSKNAKKIKKTDDKEKNKSEKKKPGRKKKIELKENPTTYLIDENNRKKQIKLFNKILNNIDISKKVEKAIYKYTYAYIEKNDYHETLLLSIYNSKINEILELLKDNKKLMKEILKDNNDNNDNIIKLPYIPNYKINPECWDFLLKKKELKEAKKKNILTSNMYKCPKCKESKCTWNQKQTRSADEPMTIFVTCLNCNYNWRDHS